LNFYEPTPSFFLLLLLLLLFKNHVQINNDTENVVFKVVLFACFRIVYFLKRRGGQKESGGRGIG
jgi:hypothetical protein